MASASEASCQADIVVVGGGLAGLTAALEAARLNPSLSILVLEAADHLGGNSSKASSGINVLSPDAGDAESEFELDTLASGGPGSSPALVHRLVHDSLQAQSFLQAHGVLLPATAQLGGHSRPRTHRNPSGPNVGTAIMKPLIAAATASPRIRVLTSSPLLALHRPGGPDGPIIVEHGAPSCDAAAPPLRTTAHSVLLAAGGFAGSPVALHRFAPHLDGLPTTNAPSAVAGAALSAALSLGAALVDLSEVQVHPTAFVDPVAPDAPSKFLAPEALRGAGALLLRGDGHRFVNELQTRDRVVEAMRALPAPGVAWLLLPAPGAAKFGQSAIDFYVARGFFVQCEDAAAAAAHIGTIEKALRDTLDEYNAAARGDAPDSFGKSVFSVEADPNATLYVARVTPAVHYCMGGVRFDEDGRVLSEDGCAVPGLFAAGEVTGGLHGHNRLAGNSLLECVVFGRRAGRAACEHAAGSCPA